VSRRCYPKKKSTRSNKLAKSEGKTESTFRVSIVGAETMLGKDIQEALQSRPNKTRVTTYSASGEGTFGEQEGEAIYVEPFSEKSVAEERMVVLAGSESGARKSYGIVESSIAKKHAAPVVIDTLGVLENEKASTLVSTLIGEVHPKPGQLLSLAHPVASALALALSRLAKYQAPVRAVANILEPASERGQRGITELHKQTAALLAFKPLPKEVFDAQLAFNTLAKLGEDAQLSLADIERRIHAHTIRLASQLRSQAAVAQLSLRLVQAPIFHGYSISLYVEFAAKPDRSAVEEALACAQIEVRALGEEAPDSVAAAGSSGLIAGDIRIDASNPKAVWIWIVFDNLRLLSDSVADIVATIRQDRP
jgi:aspartate-semialdehyde dehydrogenase